MLNRSPQQAVLDFDSLVKRLENLADFQQRKAPKIAVVGDFCLDKYLYIYPQLDEFSVETQLVAYQIRAKRLFAGVGGTIASNLCALGAETYCFGVVGEDGEGFDLLRALKKIGANVDGVVVSDSLLTGAYMKPMRPESPSVDGSLQAPTSGNWVEANRLDIRNPSPAPRETIKLLKQRLREQISQFDAVVVSDQFPSGSEAVFSDDLRSFLATLAEENPNVFFLCDSRFFVDFYRNMVVKCNANEAFDAYEAAHGAERRRETTLNGDSESQMEKLVLSGEWLTRRNKRPTLVTRGASGSILFNINENDDLAVTLIPSNPVEPPIDICGAGDATNAGLAFARALGFSLVESAYLAGVVSSITIKQIGVTGTASVKEIVKILKSKIDQ